MPSAPSSATEGRLSAGKSHRAKSREANGMTTHVSRTTRSVTKTTFWTRNGWESRNGPVTSEMMIEYLVPVGSKPNDVRVGVRVVGAKVRGLGVAPR